MKSMYASRSVPVLNTPAPNAAYVDDSSSQNESLQRKADMANGAVQRVVQRETGVVQRVGEADGKFVYCDSMMDHETGFVSQKILISPYNDDTNSGSSKGFNGCLMMAFHFVNTEEKKTQIAEMFNPRKENLDLTKTYIAHVFWGSGSETDAALVDAEQRKLIEIDVLFKPYDSRDGKNIEEEIKKSNLDDSEQALFFSAMPSFTGAMKKNGNQYSAEVFFPDVRVVDGGKRRVYNVNAYDYVKKKYPKEGLIDEDHRLKCLNQQQLKYKTLAAKAMIYASVLNKRIMTITSLFKKDAVMNRMNVLNLLNILDTACCDELRNIVQMDAYALNYAKNLTENIVIQNILGLYNTGINNWDRDVCITSEMSQMANMALAWASLLEIKVESFVRGVYNPLVNNIGKIDKIMLRSVNEYAYDCLKEIVLLGKKVIRSAMEMTDNIQEKKILREIM